MNAGKLDVLLSYFPVAITSTPALLHFAEYESAINCHINANNVYTSAHINHPFTGTIELYAKWYE